jgi:hypothetical protein
MTPSKHFAPPGSLGAVSMTRSHLLNGALCALLLPAFACNLLDVADPENAPGRGARAFDPYQSTNSGAIRLSLGMYNGCAMLPTGQSIPKNDVFRALNLPYPEECESPAAIEGFPPYIPDGELTLVTNTDYFFHQFVAVDTVVNVHTDPTNYAAVLDWFTTKSRFKSLDWGNVGLLAEEWWFKEAIPGVVQDRWHRSTLFDNQNWVRRTDDYFTIELLDAEGRVRGTPTQYLRSEFLASSPYVGHTQFSWRVEGIDKPDFPGQRTIKPLPEIPGYPPQAPVFRTTARLDIFGSTNPFKTFRIPADLRGQGAVRVTWSQIPDEPFYFPVTFVAPEDLPATCYDEQGNQNVRCSFGASPVLKIVEPANGKFFMPGEVVNMFAEGRDGEGNRLHHPDWYQSGIDTVSNNANGTLQVSIPFLDNTQELDMVTAVSMAGPLQNMRVASNPKEKRPYYSRNFAWPISSLTQTTPLDHAEFGAKWSTRQAYKLPDDAQPGTYVGLIKWNRYFNGERFVKLKPFFFQVGTEQPTTYPGNIGNCQMCHRGVLSLDNLRHGLPVDHIEACKTCHANETELGFTFNENIHRIHMRSRKFPVAKNDCTTCHFTRESAVRPSLNSCSACHLNLHGTEYFQMKYESGTEPSRFGNCAQQCHGEKPPSLHILPEK